MGNIFNQFLSGFAGGLFGDNGRLKDYKHASRLYRDNYYGMAPKAGWLYFIEIGINPALNDKVLFQSIDQGWFQRSKGKLGLMVKTADLPKFSMGTEVLNQYNKKTVIQTKMTYSPVTFTFHDDMDNMITELWKNYYQYYYADSRYDGFHNVSKNNASNPLAYEPGNQNAWRAFAYGLNNGQTVPFFSFITVYLLNRRKYTAIKLINPILTEWSHAQLDQTNGQRLLDARMTVAYEAVYYDTYDTNRVTKTEPGFNTVHYDNTPSPLSVLGGRTKGIGGLLNGAADVLGVFDKDGPLTVGDIISIGIGTKNAVQGARDLTKQGVKQELYSIANSSFSNAASGGGGSALGQQIQGIVNTPVNLSLPKGNTQGNTTEATKGDLK